MAEGRAPSGIAAAISRLSAGEVKNPARGNANGNRLRFQMFGPREARRSGVEKRAARRPPFFSEHVGSN